MSDSMQAMNPLGPDHPPVEVTFARGPLWTRRCRACGFENGGLIEISDKTIDNERNDKYSPINRPCVMCKGGPVELVRVADDARNVMGGAP